MAFQTKDFISILASMVNRMRATQDQITDYNVERGANAANVAADHGLRLSAIKNARHEIAAV
jgi:hypothetical protein